MRSAARWLLTAAVLLPPWALADETPESPDQEDAWDQADAVYPEDAMKAARAQARHEMGGMATGFVLADRFEFQSGDEDRGVWDLQGWYGTDRSRFWWKTEGEYTFDGDEFEEAEVQALWSRPVSAFWDAQVGVRYDIEPDGLAHVAAGVQGLAPQWFEVDAAAFLSDDGDLTARVEVEYELLITQRLVLQPRLELELSAQDVPERELGSGLTESALGLRLRYEIMREFAPYVGVEWQRSWGETADIERAAGLDADDTVWVLGVRAWY